MGVGRRVADAMMSLGWKKSPVPIRCKKNEPAKRGWYRDIHLTIAGGTQTAADAAGITLEEEDNVAHQQAQ